MTWAFVTEPIGEDATRLTARIRMEAEPHLSEWLMGGIIAPPIAYYLYKGLRCLILVIAVND